MLRVVVEPRVRNGANADVRKMEPMFETQAQLRGRARMARTLTRLVLACSSMVALGPFAVTEAVPLSRADTEEYVSLVPMRSLFAALRLNMGLPSEAFLRS